MKGKEAITNLVQTGTVHAHEGSPALNVSTFRSRTRLSRERYMAWDKRKRDYNIMFAVNYADGRTAYMTISPSTLKSGDHLAQAVARERQEKGEIPDGEIVAVRRVR